MKPLSKVIFSAALCTSILTAPFNSITACAEEPEIILDHDTLCNSSDFLLDKSMISIDEIIEATSDYLIDKGVAETEEDRYYISNPIMYKSEINDITNCSYFFLFENNDVIGKVNCYVYNGRPYIQIDNCISDDIQMMYESHQPLVDFANNGISNISNSSENFSMFENITLCDSSITIEKESQLPINKRLQIRQTKESASIGSFVISGIKYVPNEKVNGEYAVCWEACLAMKYNYLHNGTYTAMKVYTTIGSPDPHSVYPIDEVSYYAQDPFNMDVTLENSTLTNSDTMAKLKTKNGTKYNPIEMGVRDINTTGLSHAMLLYGIHVYSDCTDYYFYDPDMRSTGGKPKDSDGNAISYLRIYGNPLETHDEFYYITSYNNHNYHWETTIY